jgi:hypothetical protein
MTGNEWLPSKQALQNSGSRNENLRDDGYAPGYVIWTLLL